MNNPARRDVLRAIAAGLIAFAVGLSTASAQRTTERSDAPPLWRISGPQSNVYLFGSFHLLPPGVRWQTPALDAALEEARVVVFETDIAAMQNQQAMQALLLKYGVLPAGQNLRNVLGAETNADFERAATALGVTPGALAPLRPWLAALTMTIQFIVKQGLDPGNGVDQQLMRLAQARGKSIAALESSETQVRIFADLTPKEEKEFLAVALRQIRDTPHMLTEMVDAYRTGDLATLEKTLNGSVGDFPVLRQRILTDRHDKWLPQIERMIGSGTTHLIVVGAAHLAGPDSIVAMLRAKGYKVEGP
jgi:uncharacterized protein